MAKLNTLEVLRTLRNYLDEAHADDRDTVIGGRNHHGDGARGCSYCAAIRQADAILKREGQE